MNLCYALVLDCSVINQLNCFIKEKALTLMNTQHIHIANVFLLMLKYLLVPKRNKNNNTRLILIFFVIFIWKLIHATDKKFESRNSYAVVINTHIFNWFSSKIFHTHFTYVYVNFKYAEYMRPCLLHVNSYVRCRWQFVISTLDLPDNLLWKTTRHWRHFKLFWLFCFQIICFTVVFAFKRQSKFNNKITK